MIANVSAHRRANAFARALEERSARGTTPEEPAERPEHTRMLAVAGSLADMPKPELDADVKAVQRTQLMAAMEAMVREGTTPFEATDPTVPEQRSHQRRGSHRAGPLGGLRPRSRLSKSIAASGLTLGVAAGTFGGVAAASSDALPGDSLYGLKRGMEDVKLGMASSDSDRGGLYLDQASTRLNEARRLMERGRSGPLDPESVAEVRHALSGVRHDASEGRRLLFAAYRRDGSLTPIETLSTFSQTHRDSWATLRDRLPHQLGDVRDEVSSVFDAIDQQVDPLRPLLPSPSQGQGSAGPYSAPAADQPSDTHNTSSSAPGSPFSSGADHTDSPEPSTSDNDGLLGSTPSLFAPPTDDLNPPSPTAKGGRSGRIPDADVTLPPLLPGFLPDLDLDREDDGTD
ncbi:DUF5667 domain-containing protein [Streptomyces odontomachi]|uniref:DUF5667 domain-containing protein n=1 Tax=Streptomyces odontomachi TaxID=2944940 RepID=UPI00210987ED|nr:DUF5667 domain-containing protein [Streptomyces sp. ODS25]